MSLETAKGAWEPLQAALVEAIAPWCAPRASGRSTGRGRTLPRSGPHEVAPARAHEPPADSLPALTRRQWQQVGRDVLALHESYTRREATFAHEANPIHTRSVAYQLYFLPRNWYRVHRVLEALPWAQPPGPAVPPAWLAPDATGPPTLRLLDLGCGTGAFSLAWLGWLAARRADDRSPLELRLTLVDQGHLLLELAEANLRAYARRALPGVTLHFERHADGVEAFLAGRPGSVYAVAGAAMTLNELSLLGPRHKSERSVALADALQARLLPDGCLLFVEPGTRRGFMNLMALRDQLLHLPVLYPCPHNGPCPMWSGPVRHWCHSTVRLPAGFFFDAALSQRAGVSFQMRDLQLAAFAAQARPAAVLGPPFKPRSGERVVSAPMRPRRGRGGGTEPALSRIVLSCGPDGQLHERPAPAGGPYTRGRWEPAPALGAP